MIACSLCTPSASNTAAVAPTLAIAPPEAIGISEAAAERQRTTSAILGEKPTPSAARSTVLPRARVVQQPDRKAQATTASRVLPVACCAARPASFDSRARLAMKGSRPRCLPATRMPHAPTPKRTTRISGILKLDELVAVAEIERGRKATASTRPREMIDKAIASRPSLTPRMRRSVPILTR